VIGFNCPLCGTVLEVAEEKAGKVVVCHLCEERCVAPAGAVRRTRVGSDEAASSRKARDTDGAAGLFSGMSGALWCAVVLVAGVGVFSLLMPLLALLLPGQASVPETTMPWAVIMPACSIVILMVMLHGKATDCPCCRKWWVRTKVGTEFVDREVFDRRGILCARTQFRMTYLCAACRHRWSVMQADEYREPARRWAKPHRR
jgi:hypothetical protein